MLSFSTAVVTKVGSFVNKGGRKKYADQTKTIVTSMGQKSCIFICCYTQTDAFSYIKVLNNHQQSGVFTNL